MAEEAKGQKRAIQKCYPGLLKLLPISKLVEHFYSQRLLSDHQKSKIDSLALRADQIKYFLDEILIPGLSVGFTKHYDEMIIVMKESDDVVTKYLAGQLIPDASPVDIVSPSSSDTGTD